MRRLAIIAASAVAVLGLTAGTSDAAVKNYKISATTKGAKVTGYWHWAKDSKGKTRRWLHTVITDTAADKMSAAICFTTGAKKPTVHSSFTCGVDTKGTGKSLLIAGWANYPHFWYGAARVKGKYYYGLSPVKKAW